MKDMNEMNGGAQMELEIGKTYKDISVPSEPAFVVESVIDDVARGHYLGDSGPSYAYTHQLREVK